MACCAVVLMLGDDEPGSRTSWRPDEVLDAHTQLAERFTRPDVKMLGFIQDFAEDAMEQSGNAARRAFQALAAGNGEQQARNIAGSISHALHSAVTYEVTAEMTEVMLAVVEKTLVEHLYEEELPAPSGFAWFDRPFEMVDIDGNALLCRAVSWEMMHRPDPAAAIVLWTHTDDTGPATLWDRSEYPDQAEHIRQLLGPLVIMHMALFPFGVRFEGDPDWDSTKIRSANQVLAILHLLWMFLGMEITTMYQPQVARPARRRALRSLKHGEVNVIVLRRLRHPDDGRVVSHREVDWSCRWVVQGHYRHLDSYDQARHHALAEHRGTETICGACSSRLTYVRPYVKGPDGAPLRAAGPTLHKLAR